MKEEKGYRFNIGGASIVLILVVLALSVFALLSVRASFHERRLAQKTAEAAAAYYAADGTAEEIYGAAVGLLDGITEEDDRKEALSELFLKDGRAYNVVFEEDGIHYEVPVTEFSKLVVELKYSMKSGPERGTGLQVAAWKLVNEEQGDYGEAEIEIWDGEVE